MVGKGVVWTSNPWLMICNLSQTNIKYLVISSVINDLFQTNFEYLSTGKWCSLSKTNIESLSTGTWYHWGLVIYLRPTSNPWLVWCDTPCGWVSDILKATSKPKLVGCDMILEIYYRHYRVPDDHEPVVCRELVDRTELNWMIPYITTNEFLGS